MRTHTALVAFAVACAAGCYNITEVFDETRLIKESHEKPAVEPAVAEKEVVEPADPGPIEWQTLPQYTTILACTPGELNVVMRLQGRDVLAKKRQPLDLAVVIDRSGSMSGGKLQSVRAAALELLELLGAGDQVTLISYDQEVTTHAVQVRVDKDGKGQLRKHILALHTGGTTALGPATFSAIETLTNAPRDEQSLSHILLLSDGRANVGETSPHVIGARAAQAFTRGISLSTIGVGLDYNEDLMTHIADQGGGQYHYVRDDTTIQAVLEAELQGLLSTVAREVHVDLNLADGVRLKRVYGFPVTGDGGLRSIRVGSLWAGQSRDIVMRLENENVSCEEADREIGTFTVRYRDVEKDGQEATLSTQLTVVVSPDMAKVEQSENIEVTIRVAEVQSAIQLELAAKEVEGGHFEKAEQILVKALEELAAQAEATPNPALDEQIDELEQAKADLAEAKASAKMQKHFIKSGKSKAYKKKKKSKSWKKGMK